MKKYVWIYRGIRGAVKAIYPRTRVEGLENLPDEPVIFVGNHCHMHGPIVSELYIPGAHETWCAGEMMHLSEVPAYAYRDFWSEKPKAVRWLYKILSYLIAPLSVVVFNNARTIGVYHDSRSLSTMKTTVKRLEEGSSIVIFPEQPLDYNPILCQFQSGFVDVAKLYYKRTGKCIAFMPMYLAPSLKTLYLGTPVRFCPDNSMERERSRICNELMERITGLAVSLPRHRVVPYRNVPRSQYPWNTPEEKCDETACC